jgi:hypothetical protein
MVCEHARAQRKQLFVGGWIPDSPEHLVKKFSPLFETYLNEVVGIAIQPPVEFKLVPVEYSKETSFEEMMKNRSLDFVCEFLDIILRFY